MTPTARLLLLQFRTEAENWNRLATDPDDQNSFLRHAARARRDQLDWAIQQLTVALPQVEAEAVIEEIRIDRVLDSVA